MSEAADLRHKVEARAALGIIDCDVHPLPIDGAASIMRYLPKPWQERFLRKGSFRPKVRSRVGRGQVISTQMKADARKCTRILPIIRVRQRHPLGAC